MLKFTTKVAAILPATPDTLAAVLAGSQPGDTIQFSPGNWTFPTNPNGPALHLPADRIYMLNGAVLGLSGGIPAADGPCLIEIDGGSNTQILGPGSLTCAQLHLINVKGVTIKGVTFRDSHRGIFVVSTGGIVITQCTFLRIATEGVMCYPNGDLFSFDHNSLDYVFEGIHSASAQGSNFHSDYNFFDHTTRYAMEFQHHVAGFFCIGNVVAGFLPHIDHQGVSAA